MPTFPRKVSIPSATRDRLQVAVALAGLLLIAATVPMWIGTPRFPQVPLVDWLVSAPPVCDLAASGGLCASLLVAAVLPFTNCSRRESIVRTAWIVFLIAASAAVMLDQHRWQPWLWQFALFAMIFVAVPDRDVAWMARVIVISLYVHSALGKLDRSFLETHGPQLVDGLLTNFGSELPARGALRTGAALALPAGELLVALLLALRRTRRAGVVLSWFMHGGLMLALGPWGLNHQPGVLIWNAYFLAQNPFLFGERNPASTAADLRFQANDEHRGQRFSLSAMGRILFCAMIAAVPLLEPFDRMDPWLGWGLYSSRPSRLRMFVEESTVDRLPSELQPFVDPPAPLESWRRVRLDRWSLAATGAPISPQVRFQLGIVLDVGRRSQLNDNVRLQLDSAANRWTGRRTMRVIQGMQKIEREALSLDLNAQPRRRPD